MIALIALLVILAVGYAVDGLGGDGGGSPSSPKITASASADLSSTPLVRASTASTPAGTALSSLPAEARRTIALIQAGGPYPYDRDGVVFRNDEKHLPSKAAGYYHEYTVVTPGESDRGARRIIVGKGGEYYYTADHYESFVRVDVNR